MDNIILNKIDVQKNVVKYYFNTTGNINHFFRSNEIFFEFQENVSDVPLSILSIPFIGALYSLAWIKNCALWVPELDRTYFLSMKLIKQAYQEMHYDFPLKGRLIPSKIVDNCLGASNDSLLLFGGGVDAHCSYIRNKEKVSYIANIQGWFKDINDVDKGAEDDFNHCNDFAFRNDINFLYVKSNFAQIVKGSLIDKHYKSRLQESWWHGFQHSQAFISTAIVLCYKHQISNIIIGSSNTVGDLVACASDITTDSLFTFASNGAVLHDAFELDRQQKIEVIVNHQRSISASYPLKVCSFNDHNCCECEKCFRTIIEIVAEGGNVNDFGFNIKRPLKEFFEDVVYRKLGLWGMDFERRIYWNSTMKRMRDNYDNIKDKEFVDWFLNFDFDKAKKDGLRRYYRQNFFSILKRKLHI